MSTGTRLALMLSIAAFTAIFYYFFIDHAIIVTASLFGAYFFIRGWSLFFGGYTNEFELYMAGENGELGQVSWSQWVYWILMILLFLIGINIQLADRRKHMEAYRFKGYYNANMESYQSYQDKM